MPATRRSARGLAVLLVWASLSVALVARARTQALDDAGVSAVSFATSLRDDIEQVVSAAREDVDGLATAAGSAELDRGRVEALFSAYAATHRAVSQVRLLDAQGRERVRIQREGERVVAIDDLQDKSDRYYFQAAAGLQAGSVFVSRIDLNVEYGKVERPLRPTVRFAAPVWGPEGPAGVVVLNLDAAPLLELVERRRELAPGRLLLVDREGVYVSHPDANEQWGGPSMLDSGAGLTADDPDLAQWLWAGPDRASRRHNGVIEARASALAAHDLPRVLLLVPNGAALADDLAAFVPAVVLSAATFVVIVVVFLARARTERLRGDLAREVAHNAVLSEREAQLREAQTRLVASARHTALSASAATLAHELRNPLGAIVTSAGLLQADETLDEESRELMGIVRGEAERLERAVARFVELARPSRPTLESVELTPLTREVVELARHDPACGEGLELSFEADEGLPTVRADPDEIRQVLWNLLRNAGNATRKEGGAHIDVSLRPLPGRAGVRLEIHDEGSGPPSDSPDDWPTRGTGVGLIVVAGVLARYGGTFELMPRPDRRGAIARVDLPAEGRGGANAPTLPAESTS